MTILSQYQYQYRKSLSLHWYILVYCIGRIIYNYSIDFMEQMYQQLVTLNSPTI